MNRVRRNDVSSRADRVECQPDFNVDRTFFGAPDLGACEFLPEGEH